MIIVTGAVGFIGSCLIGYLNEQGYNAIVAVDDFSNPEKAPNLDGKKLLHKIHRDEFPDWVEQNQEEIEFIFHLGARTDTTEFDRDLLFQMNTEYSKRIWKLCVAYQLPLVYASSAATYGDGSQGYKDNEAELSKLEPLNPYGESKHAFDLWAVEQDKKPFFWAGLKFFNVYGPNEYHKGRMASVVLHAYRQIKETGQMKLFRSHHPDYRDGEQQRDFIYVKDVCSVCYWLMHHRENPGIYNLGSGKARTFLDLVHAVFSSMDRESDITFIDTPEDIREKYQYFTEASMAKLRQVGYREAFTTIEEGVREYVREYLEGGRRY